MIRIAMPIKRERKPRQDREHAEAVKLMQLVRMHENRWPALKWLFHVPNGGARSKAAGGKLKAEGVKRGVPDYLLPCPSANWCGLALELKAKGGRLETEQRTWLDHFDAQGWQSTVCFGAEEAWAVIRDYVRGCE